MKNPIDGRAKAKKRATQVTPDRQPSRCCPGSAASATSDFNGAVQVGMALKIGVTRIMHTPTSRSPRRDVRPLGRTVSVQF
jgi:hypothetical protein